MLERSFLLVLLLLVVQVHHGQTMDDAAMLHKTLLADYNKHIRPSVDQSKPVIVNVTFDLVPVREVDEIMGKISLVGALWLIWKEPRMLWNPFAYSQPTKAVGADHYWYPVRIYYDGTAVWTPIDVVTTTCTFDITYYPFAVQTCEISFMPYGAFVNEIYLHAAEKEVSRRYFTENGEWALEKAETVSGLIDEQFPTFVIVLELRRRPTFVIVNVILPILFMGLLNALVFFLPASSGERVSFAMTVLLAIAVFLTLVGDNMPKTSQPMSTICYFLLTNLVLSSLIMIVTVLNLNLYHKVYTTTVPHLYAL
ncbi:neuronal acetylcholine receptor subunit alpha-3-like [Ruditapes philippinarum]|uniref:neuronal acetylcholine receptor subunit alpha-3-like n=1 Tax=Ruditapes philippinarum TaxID=129788 RepID=UPI00295B9018|nr:neuronal acetylcholine receptor subunit alpha-3-like [Ruditapes philippinarum]